MLSCPSLDHPVGRYESSETLTRKGQGRKKSGSAVRATVNHSRLCDFSNMHVSYNLLQCNIHFCVHVKIIFFVISILHQPVLKLISLNFLHIEDEICSRFLKFSKIYKIITFGVIKYS